MVRKCIICGASQSKQNIALSFHRFPKDGSLRHKWLIACNLNEDTIKPDSLICSKHFIGEDYDSTVWPTVRLCPNAVPCPSNIYRIGQDKLPSMMSDKSGPGTSTAIDTCTLTISASVDHSINIENLLVPRTVIGPSTSSTNDFVSNVTADISRIVQNVVVPTTVIRNIEQTPTKIIIRNIGDLQPQHFSTPSKAKRHLEFVKDEVQRYQKRIKVLKIQKKRLEDRINSLSDLMEQYYH